MTLEILEKTEARHDTLNTICKLSKDAPYDFAINLEKNNKNIQGKNVVIPFTKIILFLKTVLFSEEEK